MSMTKEEAIYWLDNGWRQSLEGKYREAFDMAIATLRPITRERVERVWRGEWLHKKSPYDYKIFVCKRCGKQISIQGGSLIFCPACGAAQTDKAVDMVMERLEALYEET